MKLVIPDVPPSPNRVLGKHWSTKAGVKDAWVMLVRSQIMPGRISTIKKQVKITLHHSRLYDKDNAYASCKPVIDALKHWNLIWDDSAAFLDLTVEQKKCKHRDRHTVIDIETL